MSQPIPAGFALTPAEKRHARFLDTRAAFALCSGLDMVTNGGDGDGGGGQGGDGGSGAGAGTGAGAQGGGNGTGTGSQVPDGYAVDDQGRSLGYPKDTPVAQMNPTQEAAYWKNQSQKHEGRYKNLTGDRSFDDTKKALDEYAQLQQQQQTPTEQALNEAREQGKQAAKAEANNQAAKAIFEGTLRAAQMNDADIKDLVESLNVGRYIGDDGQIDTAGLTSFATRFTSGTGNQQQRRDFGGGQRNEGQPSAGEQGKAQLARRFPAANKN